MASRRLLPSLMIGAAFALTSAVASAQNVPRNRTLIVAAQVEAPVFRNVGLANPFSINNEDYRVSIINMFEPLFYYNVTDNSVIPWLATGYAYNADFSALTVTLRDGVTWSDGKPFGVHDVLFTLNMLIENGRGKKDLLNAAALATSVKAVAKVDDHTVRIDLSEPDPRFAFKYLINYFDIGLQWVPEHIWKDAGDPAAFRFFDVAKGWPVTTSPWTVSRFTDAQVFIDRRDDWWAAKAKLAPMPEVRRIITVPGGTRDRMVQLISSNQADIVNDIQVAEVVRQVVTQNPKITTWTGKDAPYGARDWWPTSLYFNHKSGKWADIRLRRAIGHYIDRKQIIDVAYSGAAEPKVDPFPGFGALKPYIDAIAPVAAKHGVGIYDKAKGDALMGEAGYKKNAAGIWEKDGQPLSVVIEAIPVLNAVGPIVAQQLKNAGVDASFRSTPESRAVLRDGRFDLTLFGHRGSIADPYATLEMYHSRNAFEVGRPTLFPARWSNADYDKIVDEIGRLAPDNPGIKDLVVAAMDIWMREAVEVPISEWYHRVPMNQTYWTGWPTKDDPYMQPTFWYTSGSFGYVLPRLKPVQ